MKTLCSTILLMLIFGYVMPGLDSKAQEIEFIPRGDTVISGTPGSELIIYLDVINVSQDPQTVFIVRTINDLPQDWTSAICFERCFAPTIDSVATTPDFGSSPIGAGDSLEVSLHFFTSSIAGTGDVQLQAGTFNFPEERITVNLAGTTQPTAVEPVQQILTNYSLEQNYPNPFNPGTVIKYSIPESGLVTLDVYNSLGERVVSLVNELQEAGRYEVNFDASKLSSGFYIYSLKSGNFVSVKKMLLMK